VRVADHVDKMLDALSVTKWFSTPSSELMYRVPTFVQEKRFANWISNAQDWNISRNRYWGTPLPLWVSDDFSEVFSDVFVSNIYRSFVLAPSVNLRNFLESRVSMISTEIALTTSPFPRNPEKGLSKELKKYSIVGLSLGG
jgi:isoleucyl-tRNA synthetase